MPEPEAQNPELDKASAEKALTEKRITEIHDLVSTHVDTTPLEGHMAIWHAESFGLNPDDYSVFEDTRHDLQGSFFRFIPKDSAGETLDGLDYLTAGGPTHDLNRYAYHTLLKPDGSVIGNVVTENSKGKETTEITAAPSDDTAELAKYVRQIEVMHIRALNITQERVPVETQPAEPGLAHKRGRGLLGLLKNRS